MLLSENETRSMIVGGFVEPLVKELPMCYDQQPNQLIRLEMSGALG